MLFSIQKIQGVFNQAILGEFLLFDGFSSVAEIEHWVWAFKCQNTEELFPAILCYLSGIKLLVCG